MPDSFAHLHVHTEFSMLDGAAKIAPLFAEAERLGMPAIAMTDHGNMFAAAEFHRASTKTTVKPVIGIEAYVAPGSRHHKCPVFWGQSSQRGTDEFGEGGDVSGAGAYTHMTMLAEDATGLRNLFRLSSEASSSGFYRKPRVDRDLIAQHATGVIATTGCPSGEVQTRLRLGQLAEALQAAADLRDLFGADNFFLELMDHGLTIERSVREGLLDIGRRLGIRAVATNDSHYVTRDQAGAHAALLCVQAGKTLSDPKRFQFNGDGYYLKSAEEMRDYWDREVPGAADATLMIADRVGSYESVFAPADLMPQFPVPDGQTAESYLADQVVSGLSRRYPTGVPSDRRARADYELGVIAAMGFPGYFLIVADLCDYARGRGIRTNTRGSAAGSIVAYALGITDLDPIEHSLMFERFLNPERISPPDIDLDVDDSRRGEVVRYLIERWGADRVAQISAPSRIKAKAAIKDAARVLGHPYTFGEHLTKIYPPAVMGFDAPLSIVTDTDQPRYAEADEMRSLLGAVDALREVYELAEGMEGLVRQNSVHAAGVLLSREPLADVLPVWTRDDGAVIAGFDYPTCEGMGLLKVDVLGSRNLGILDDALRIIRDHRGEEIDLATVPLDDAPTFELLARGDTLGVFQLDGAPIRDLLRRMAPTRFGDISATIALYRPGPMGANAHLDYADRKNRRKPVTPIHPELAEVLEPVLGETYGVICYQEQVVEVAQRVAGYTLGRADILRRAMGKKKPAELARERPAFFTGMASNGFSEGAATALWDVLLPFAAYAFGRAHAASYAMIGYWTAYLKANHPAEYMAALLSSVADNKDRMALYLGEARVMGVPVLPPCVVTSGHQFTVTPNGVRFGLDAVRNVGGNAAEAVIQARTGASGSTFHGFLSSLDTSRCGKRAVESLIKAGAFDSFGHTRRSLVEIHSDAVDAAAAVRRSGDQGMVSMFDDPDTDDNSSVTDQVGQVPVLPEWDRSQLFAYERDQLGLYVTGHPLDGMEHALRAVSPHSVAHVLTESQDEDEMTIAGMVTAVTSRTSKGGRQWATVAIEDLGASVEVLLFGRSFASHRDALTVDAVVVVRGRVSHREDRVCVIGSSVSSLDQARLTSVAQECPSLPAVVACPSDDEIADFVWQCLAPLYDR